MNSANSEQASEEGGADEEEEGGGEDGRKETDSAEVDHKTTHRGSGKRRSRTGFMKTMIWYSIRDANMTCPTGCKSGSRTMSVAI